jgi:hypothetical protein
MEASFDGTTLAPFAASIRVPSFRVRFSTLAGHRISILARANRRHAWHYCTNSDARPLSLRLTSKSREQMLHYKSKAKSVPKLSPPMDMLAHSLTR